MEYELLNELSDRIREGLEERKKQGDVDSFEVFTVPDDFKIELRIVNKFPVPPILVSLRVAGQMR